MKPTAFGLPEASILQARLSADLERHVKAEDLPQAHDPFGFSRSFRIPLE